jgi:hypothetical protein
MTPAQVIAEARQLVQDTLAPYRYSDSVLLGFVNQTLKRMAILRPDLFSFITNIPTTANVVVQSCPADSVRLVEIFQVVGGSAVTEVSRDTLDQSAPNWVSDPAGSPVNYVRHVRNPNRFFLYPRPTSGTQLVAEYIQSPSDYALNDSIALLPDSYLTTVVDGVVYLAESVDNEHVNSGRAALFYNSFVQALGVGAQSRVITDTEEGGLDPKQVV